MTSRTLPPDEWPRLSTLHPEMTDILPLFRPGDVRVVVVEDGDQIVAAWAVLRVVHLEGAWIDPTRRRSPGVSRLLLQGALAAMADWAGQTAWTAAMPGDVSTQTLIAKLGGQRVPADSFVLPLERMEALCRLDS